MSAGTFIGYFFVNIAQALLHLVRRDSGFLQPGGTVGDQRVELHGVTGVYAQHGRGGGVVITPGHGLGRRGQLEMLRRAGLHLGRGHDGNKNQEEKRAHVPPNK